MVSEAADQVHSLEIHEWLSEARPSALAMKRRVRIEVERIATRAKAAMATTSARMLKPTKPRGLSSSWMKESPARSAFTPRWAA